MNSQGKISDRGMGGGTLVVLSAGVTSAGVIDELLKRRETLELQLSPRGRNPAFFLESAHDANRRLDGRSGLLREFAFCVWKNGPVFLLQLEEKYGQALFDRLLARTRKPLDRLQTLAAKAADTHDECGEAVVGV